MSPQPTGRSHQQPRHADPVDLPANFRPDFPLLENARVIVVDDYPSLGKAVCQLLNCYGIEDTTFIHVTSFDDALEALKEEIGKPTRRSHTLLLSDYNFRGGSDQPKNGADLVAEVRSHFAGSDSLDRLAIYGMSSDDRVGDRFLQAGADGFLEKGVLSETELALFEQALERKPV